MLLRRPTRADGGFLKYRSCLVVAKEDLTEQAGDLADIYLQGCDKLRRCRIDISDYRIDFVYQRRATPKHCPTRGRSYIANL